MKPNNLNKHLLLSLLIAALSACSGGGGGGDSDNDSNPTDGTTDGTTDISEVNVSTSGRPVFNLSGVVTLMEYDDIIEQPTAEAASAFSLTGLTSMVSTQSVLDSIGASNLLGIDEDGNTVFPIDNIDPLYVDYSVLSPDQKILYIAIRSAHHDSEVIQSVGYESAVIGPTLSADVPLSETEALEKYPDGFVWLEEDFNYYENDTCSGVFSLSGLCVTYLVIQPDWDPENVIKYNLKELLDSLQNILLTDYVSCSLVALDRLSGEVDCLGGTEVTTTSIRIMDIGFPIQIRTAKLERDTTQADFEAIRPGLKPLQFDDAGNLYTMASRFDNSTGYYSGSELTRITPAGDLEQIISLDSITVGSFLALANGDIAARLSGSNDGIFLIQDGNLIKVSDDYDFKADTGSTLIINNHLVKALPGGGFARLPLSFNGGTSLSRLYLSDEGFLYGCGEYDTGLIRILPFQQDYITRESGYCEVGTISQGHRVTVEEIGIGNLGTTEIIKILRLSDGVSYHIFEESDYSTAARYNITNLAYGANKIIFSADRTTTPLGTVLGEIDVQKLSQGLPEAEYLTLTDVNSSTAASNTVRKITPLPIIEPTSTASAPKITEVYFNDSEHSQLGFEFSEFMDKTSVIDSLSLQQNGGDISYVPFWGYQKLYLLADTNGLGDNNNNGTIDSEDYQAFQPELPYDINFDTNTAMDISGRLLATSSSPNASHQLTFVTRAGFYKGYSENLESQASLLRSTNTYYSLIDASPNADNYEEYWHLSPDYNSRAFKVIELPESLDDGSTPLGRANYRIEFTTYCEGYGLGVGLRDADTSATAAEYTYNHWASSTAVQGFGIQCSSDDGYVYRTGGLNSSSSPLLAVGEKQIRIDSFGSVMTFYVYDADTQSYTALHTSTAASVSGSADLWLGAHYDSKVIDNLRISRLKDDGAGNPTEDGIYAESDFEDADDPFGAFSSLRVPATDEL